MAGASRQDFCPIHSFGSLTKPFPLYLPSNTLHLGGWLAPDLS
jgi:hypothetical protein